MDAPPEVLCLIFDHLPNKCALKAVRLVCKTFDQVAVPLLFDQIYMSDKQADMKIANLTVSRSDAYVRTLVLKSVYHISKTRPEISHDTYCRSHWCECFHDHVQHAWKINEGLHPEEQEAAKSGDFERNEAELWHMLLLALAVTRTTVKEITAVDEDCERALSVNALRMSQPQARNLADSFQCLRTIRLSFFQCAGGYNIPEGSSQTQGYIAKALATASNLECIHIITAEHTEGPQYHPRTGTTFRAVFGGCTFPRLKSFTLWCIDSTEEEFLEFLEGSPSIEYLELDSMALMSGSWEYAANIMKATLPLKELVFRQFSLGLSQPFSHVEFNDVPNIVEKLFFGSGRNPFIKAVLQELHSLNRFSAS